MVDSLKIKPLSSQEVTTIYERCLEFLSSKGVKVFHTEILKTLEKEGAWVDIKKQQLRLPRDIIEEALRTVPRSFKMAGKESEIILPHPEGASYARNGTGAQNFLDPETNAFHDMTRSNVQEAAQLLELMDGIQFTCFPFIRDVPGETADIYGLKTLFENTTKPVMIQPYSYGSPEYLFELAIAKAGSAEALKKKPVITIIPCPVTPFEIKDMDAKIIQLAARYGVPIQANPLPSAGGTSPVTIAGTVLMNGIEVLAMLVMSQMFQPGTPVIGSPLFFTLDMINGRALGSSIESILGAAASVQFLKEAFHVPTYTWGFGSESHFPDGQAMIETTLRGLLISMVGVDILGGAGQLSTALVFSPVQLIIDNALVQILNRVNCGVKVDDDTLAWEDILDTEPGSHFLRRRHTLKHCRESIRTKLFAGESLEAWRLKKGGDLYDRALQRYKEIKKVLKPVPLPADVKKEIDNIVKKADEYLVH